MSHEIWPATTPARIAGACAWPGLSTTHYASGSRCRAGKRDGENNWMMAIACAHPGLLKMLARNVAKRLGRLAVRCKRDTDDGMDHGIAICLLEGLK